MNKWRLLLFSVFGLLQITTSDRFIDGREQCCNHRVFRSDTRPSTYEPYRLSSELRQLKSPDFRRIDQERRSIRGSIRRESPPQDENRRAIENRGIRELTDVTERDITRARSYEDRRISPGNVHRDALVNRDRQLELNTRSTITGDDHRRNDARNHLENRDNTRKTFASNTREERLNVRRDISEREERKVSRLASRDRSINTDYDKESRNTMQNTRHVRIERANNRDDSDRRVLRNARRETFETRIVNNLDDRVSRLRTRRSSLEDLRETDVLSFRVRSARNYDSVESRNNAGFNRGNQNREEIQNENRDRISRKNGRGNSLRILRERFTTENRLSERANARNIRLGKRGISEETNRNIRTNMYTGDSNIISKAGSQEYRGTDKNSGSDKILNDRIRNDNNDNRLFRRAIAKNTLNIMERHIQVDDSRIPGHFRNSRGNSERRSNERIVRSRFDGIKRERTVRNEVWQERLNNMEESRIQSSSVPKTYDNQNTREDMRSEIHRVKSNSAERRNFHSIGENHNSARRNTNQDAHEFRSRELWQAKNIRRQIDVSRRNTPTDNEVQNFRYNVNEALDRIRSQSPQERRLTRDARDSVTREQNSRDESLHRIRSRSLEERFSMIQEERTRNIRANKETHQQPNPRDTRDNRISQERSNERITRDRSDSIRRERTVRNDVRQERFYDMEESRIRSSSAPKLHDNQNTRDVRIEISRLRSNSAERRNFRGMDERRVRRNTNQDASRYISRELRQEQNIRRQIDVSRMYRSTPTENDVRKSRYNNNEALDGIRSQSPQDRRLTREARDLETREQTSREESLHRIRSRSLEQSFGRERNDRDEYKTRSIRANEESRQQRARTAESISAYAQQKVQNIRLYTNNDVRNSRYNDEEDFRQIRSIDTKEKSRDARDTSDRRNVHDIRDSRDESHIRQDRQITPRERYESRIRIEFRDRSVSLPNYLRNSRNNNEESRRLQSRGIEERYLARKTTHEITPIIDARNTRNIREELNRDRSRSMKDKRDIRELERDEARIRTNYARTSEVRNTRDLEMSRRIRRESSTERLMNRNIRENRQNHENVERRTNLVRENREKLIIDSIRTMPMITKQSENYVCEIKWQYLFYALQGIYLCSLFMKISKDEQSKKKLRTTSWLLPVDYLKID